MNYWNNLFNKEGALWSFEPSDSSLFVSAYFKRKGYKNILIPGVGYGRNAMPFFKNKMNITGIEISGSAIALARKNGFTFPILHGSVLSMPFNDSVYDGIFCYSLLHLFNTKERIQILEACFQQLNNYGTMVFVVVSTKADIYGQGEKLAENYYKLDNGLPVFFYNQKSIEEEFSKFGLLEYKELEEPIKFMEDAKPISCWCIECRKQD